MKKKTGNEYIQVVKKKPELTRRLFFFFCSQGVKKLNDKIQQIQHRADKRLKKANIMKIKCNHN